MEVKTSSIMGFLGPFLLLVLAFYFVPVILTVILSFTSMDYKLSWDFVGFSNFEHFLTQSLTYKILLTTLIYVALTLIFNVGIAFLLALMTTYFTTHENTAMFFRAIWLLPRLTPVVVYCLLWMWIFEPTQYGLFNTILSLFGKSLSIDWFSAYPMGVIVFANGFIGASFGMVTFSSAIKSISRDYIWSAQVDGAGDWQIVRRIIVPMIKWEVMYIFIWQTLSLLNSYVYILILTDGGPLHETEVWSLYSYHKAFKYMEFGNGAALSLLLVIIGIVFTFIGWKIFGFRRMMGQEVSR